MDYAQTYDNADSIGTGGREVPQLFTMDDLLVEYSTRVRSWVQDAEQIALMNRSEFLRDVFAYAATIERYTSKELFEELQEGKPENIEFRYDWLHKLGRVVALQKLSESDTDFALACLSKSTNRVSLRSMKRENARLRIQLHIERREFREAEVLLTEYADLLGREGESLAADARNPFINPAATSIESWLTGFNAPLSEAGLSTIYLDRIAHTPFDAVRALPSTEPSDDGPLVSVIMTNYASDEVALEFAARSILNQSWRNLELIVVDDATPSGSPQILKTLADADPRMRVIELEENRGTYHARNVGLQESNGVYVTGQDSDDWSHPDRVYLQVQALMQSSENVGVVGQAIRADDNLSQLVRGTAPMRMCEVSLMFPTDVGRSIGGYLESRKAADSEFRLRLELYTGKPVKRLEEPLYLTRLSTGSLSRGEFKVGWAHPNRRAFLSFMQHWHEYAPQHELVLPRPQNKTVGIPNKFQPIPARARRFDYLYISDWRHDSGRTRSALAEIEALRANGLTVGIMHLGGIFPGKAPLSHLSPIVQSRISSGDLHLVIPDEGAHITTVIVKGPEILQFAPTEGFDNSVDNVLIIADLAPSAWDGAAPLYDLQDCSRRAAMLFGKLPMWIAQDPAILRYLLDNGQHCRVRPNLLPYISPDLTERSELRRNRIRHEIPVIGGVGTNLDQCWPKDRAQSEALWPEDGNQAGVKILGTEECFSRRYGNVSVPQHWEVIRQRDAEEFYKTIDYLVYYPEENWPQEFSYDALVAYSKGAAVILPERFEPFHRGMAITLSAEDAANFIRIDWLTSKVLSEGSSKELSETAKEQSAFVADLATAFST